jgi:hypothetical protein
MDWLDKHHVFLDFYKKAFTFLYEEGYLRKLQEIPRVVNVREISSLQLKKSYRKGCQIFFARQEEIPKDKV